MLGSEDALVTDYAQGVTLAGNCSTTLAKPYNCFGSKLDKHWNSRRHSAAFTLYYHTPLHHGLRGGDFSCYPQARSLHYQGGP